LVEMRKIQKAGPSGAAAPPCAAEVAAAAAAAAAADDDDDDEEEEKGEVWKALIMTVRSRGGVRPSMRRWW
jgi:ribosomal protein L12E/L44/L45/RPP1/RPP2